MHTGSCLCGEVRFEFDGEPGAFGYCHCTSCRKASGSAHSANAPIEREAFRLTAGAGALREFEHPPGRKRTFCSHCGSPIYSYLVDAAQVLRIRLGCLDTPFEGAPQANTFMGDKADWDPGNNQAPQFSEFAPHSVLSQKGSRQPE